MVSIVACPYEQTVGEELCRSLFFRERCLTFLLRRIDDDFSSQLIGMS